MRRLSCFSGNYKCLKSLMYCLDLPEGEDFREVIVKVLIVGWEAQR
jgi:hypothetical protein